MYNKNLQGNISNDTPNKSKAIPNETPYLMKKKITFSI